VSLEEDIRRGHKAEELLKHELMVEAREHMEKLLWQMFRDTPPESKDRLAYVSAMSYFHKKYAEFFQQAITNGKLAQINLEAKKKSLKERVFG
jgi:hypothetical protein